MAKQMHIRVDDDIYKELCLYSDVSGQTIQDSLSVAIRQLLVTAKAEPARDGEDYTFIDLFAGIGGLRLAFESAGGRCVYSNDWNKYCQKTYYANFGVQPDGDITKVDAQRIPEHDILVAGFPCQPFSIAGVSKKNSLGRATGFEDKTQGTLFFDVCRILKAKRPKAFMLENVKNLCSHDGGRTFQIIQESLKELKYAVFFQVLDGKDFVPQHRERIVIVGFDTERYGKNIDFTFRLSPPEKPPTVKDILEAKPEAKYTLSDKLWAYLQNYAEKHREAGNGFGYGIAPLDGVTRTLSARYHKDGSEILVKQKGKNPRRLTPRECARLQGFPDTFKIPVSDTQAYRQFGNSVVVPLMSNVAALIVSKLKELDPAARAFQTVETVDRRWEQMAERHASQAIQAVLSGQQAYCKFLSANDTGLTGGHQAGIYISKPSIPILFDEPGVKGCNKEKWAKIKWQDGTETDSRFTYYGQGTRDEYRITNFGRGFPFLRPEYTGALFVLVQNSPEDYQSYVLNTEDDIDQFLDAFSLSPADTNRLIEAEGTQAQAETQEQLAIQEFIRSLTVDFPASEEMSAAARDIQNRVYRHFEQIRSNPDKKLIAWTNTEYALFRAIEHARYGDTISGGFASVEDFVTMANMVLNRRKSRAGKSLEHHLAAIFDGNGILYTAQAVTEGNKRPDFLFPSQAAYHDPAFPTERLISLAAKTTCKDRWRQVINEADRLRDKPKFLCTLQQGISPAQMDEMQAENVILVVPKPYIAAFPKDRQDRIWTLAKFVRYVRETEGIG